MNEKDELPTPTANGRNRKLLLLMAAAGLVILTIAAAVRFLPRLLGADEAAIAQVMPEETAVFLELNLLNLQNEAARQLADRLEETYSAADIPLSTNDPSTLFNALDGLLREATGLTVSEDVRPWVGPNIGLALLPDETGVVQTDHPAWVVAATIRDDDKADAFLSELTAVLQANQGEYSGFLAGYEPQVVRQDNLLLFASDPQTLAAVIENPDGLSLADSKRFQETMGQMPADRGATVYVAGEVVDSLLDTAVPAIGVAQGILPTYTAVGMAAFATEAGIQIEMVGPHEPLNETQEAYRAAQTGDHQTAAALPEETAVFLTGQRLDLLWQLAKGSLDSLGYAEADVDEAMQLFAGLFGFNPDTELLASLEGAYSLALLLPDAEAPGVVLLAAHEAPGTLNDQAESFAAGLAPVGLAAENANGIYTVTDEEGRPLAAYAVHDGYLVVGNEAGGVTAVTQSTNSLADNPAFQTAWAALPDGTVPVLFMNLAQIPEFLAIEAADNPISRAVFGTKSDEAISRGSLILFVGP